MQPHRAALIIAGLALANGPSLAGQLPDLTIAPVDGTLVKKCAGASNLGLSFDVQITNVGKVAATLTQSPWAAWLRVSDPNWFLSQPFSLDQYVAPPPSSLTPGQTAKLHVSRTVRQTATGGWQVIVTADPYNWIWESNELNNGFGMGPSQDTICK